MKIAILSDIHGNLEAFRQVYVSIMKASVDGIVLLGDIIDYCPHSNEVITILNNGTFNVLCSIWGNHEKMILERDYSSFDLDRGVVCAEFTRKHLSSDSITYLYDKVTNAGKKEFMVGSKKCLAVHGNIIDNYWTAIDIGQDYSLYKEYDFVFSGHSHIPHCFEVYYPSENVEKRYKKKTIFINPGSVGQPRNLLPLSQYAVLDTESEALKFCKVPYDVTKEQLAFSDEIDDFYRIRLTTGI